jgi:nitroreductase
MKNPLLTLGLSRRSVRRYGNRPVAREVIDEILKVALTAPTSFGCQDVEFVLVHDKATIRRLGAAKLMGGSQINGADWVVVVMSRTADNRAAEFWIENAAIASAYLLLAAEQFDVGACWVQIRNRRGNHSTSDEEIRSLLNVPNGYTVLNLVALGEKGEHKPARSESGLAFDNIHNETF